MIARKRVWRRFGTVKRSTIKRGAAWLRELNEKEIAMWFAAVTEARNCTRRPRYILPDRLTLGVNNR